MLDVSGPVVGAPSAWSLGYTGRGEAIAIVDTGVHTDHPFLRDKVISSAEACYSSGVLFSANWLSLCANGAAEQVGPGAGVNCSAGLSSLCSHGTHVAGIALGNGHLAGVGFSGVAKDAELIPIQVFSWVNGRLAAFDSDVIAALEHVLDLHRQGIEVASVNMSLGGDTYTSALGCDQSAIVLKQAIDNLRAVGIPTVIAAGNDGKSTAIARTGCISTAVSVGATTDTDGLASFSNRANWLSVYAPGYGIKSSIVGTGYQSWSGTSMATPHVAGAMAVLGQKLIAESLKADLADDIDSLLAALRMTGIPIADSGPASGLPRIQVDEALSTIQDPPPVDIILDSQLGSSAVSVVSGSFASSSNTASYGGSYLAATSTTTSNIFRFTPELSDAGLYRLYAFWPALQENATTVTLAIRHEGTTDSTTVNQTSGGGVWNDLGAYYFAADGSEYVELSGPKGVRVVADAVRLESLAVMPLAIATQALASGYVGVGYTGQLAAVGGLQPYEWAMVSGSLPAGLSIDPGTGRISGAPSQEGAREFVVRVQDALGDVASKGFTITIDPTPTVVAKYSFDNGSIAPWQQLQSGTVSLVADGTGYVLRKSGNNDPDGGWAPFGTTLDDFDLVLFARKVNTAGGDLVRYSLTDDVGNGYGLYLDYATGKLSIERRPGRDSHC